MDKIERGLNKIDEFLEDKIVAKIQKLKLGQLFIKSITGLEDPTQTTILYEKELKKKRASIYSYSQIIPTVIGPFLIGFDLNYQLGVNATITLSEFRNVDFALTFYAELLLDVKFGYGICYILEFGLFVRGRLLNGQIRPGISLNGLIPVQLVKAVADVPEMKNSNVLEALLFVDLTLYAFQVTYGFYLKHIWL